MKAKPKMEDLKYCPRTKHAWGRPLKAAHPLCHQMGKNQHHRCKSIPPEECTWFPIMARYCEENKIKITMPLRFRCILYKKVKVKPRGAPRGKALIAEGSKQSGPCRAKRGE